MKYSNLAVNMSSVSPLLKEDGEPYKIAVLIPTINNALELDIVLERLSKQTYPDFCGVYVWEYFNCPPEQNHPEKWCETISKLIN